MVTGSGLTAEHAAITPLFPLTFAVETAKNVDDVRLGFKCVVFIASVIFPNPIV